MKPMRIMSVSPLVALLSIGLLNCGSSAPSLTQGTGSPASSIAISPTSAPAGSADLTLTILGSNFLGEAHNYSQGVWSMNGTNTLLATAFLSKTQLTAVVPSNLLVNSIAAQVFVQTGDPMGDIPLSKSRVVNFSVTTPSIGTPSITAISPQNAVAGSPDLTLTVTGSNYVSGVPHKRNVVVWSANGNRTSLATTFVTSSELTAVIPAALLSNPATAQMIVEIWDDMGDVPDRTSNSVVFVVKAPAIPSISASSTTFERTSGAPNVVTDWNQIAETAVVAVAKKAPAASPVFMSYVHGAMFDAVNSIDRRFQPFKVKVDAPRDAAIDAAVVAAAHRALVRLFPDQQGTFDAAFSASMGAIPDGFAKINGVATGEAVANKLMELRANDGLEANVVVVLGDGPGAWVHTSPLPAQPVAPWMAQFTPFTFSDPAQFLPREGPPELTSSLWARDYNLTKTLGSQLSAQRTLAQTEIGLFWSDHTQVQYDGALRNLVAQRNLSVRDSVRLYAMENIAVADALVGCMNAKYHFLFWRPVTAIRAGDTDGNPDTAADPAWNPLAPTPNHPEYPANHGCATQAFVVTLQSYFGTNSVPTDFFSHVTNTTHHFKNLSDIVDEVAVARIYGGMHYHHSVVQGRILGRRVARHMLEHFFRPREGEDDDSGATSQ